MRLWAVFNGKKKSEITDMRKKEKHKKDKIQLDRQKERVYT